MKVLLVANYEPDAQQSMSRYAEFLRGGLEELGNEIKVIRPAAMATRLLGRQNRLSKWLGYIDKFLLFPPLLWLRSRRVDLVHVCDHSNSGYLRWTGATPSIITVHDVLAIRSALGEIPQHPVSLTGRMLQGWILGGLASARHIVCVSSKTRGDLERLLPSAPKAYLIHHALNWQYAPAAPEEVAAARQACGFEQGEQYFLHIGGNQWYKNRLGAMRIVLELRKHKPFQNLKIVLAGKPWTKEMRSFKREHAFNSAIELIDPANEQLRALYSGASALLFPSWEEGFGWPILEAQVCNCLVITSNRPPMTEIAGEGAIFIDPADVEASVRTILQRLPDAEVTKRAAIANLQRFSMNNVMARYSDCYKSVLAQRRATAE